jgi:hypothetical protein
MEWKAQEKGNNKRGGGTIVGACCLFIFHHSQPHTITWSTTQGTRNFNFVALGDGKNCGKKKLLFILNDHFQLLCKHQTLEQISSWYPLHPTIIAIVVVVAAPSSYKPTKNPTTHNNYERDTMLFFTQ